MSAFIDVQVTMTFRVCLADEKSDLASCFDGELARKAVAEAASNAVEAAEQEGFTHQHELDLSLQFRDLTTKVLPDAGSAPAEISLS